MIKVNDTEIKIEHYPDGTPRINVDTLQIGLYGTENHAVCIKWIYENDAELFYLMMIKKHFEAFYHHKYRFVLQMSYVPNARMDRVKTNDEIFTLKYFCEFINWLNFDDVYILDPHSNVVSALLNNCWQDEIRGLVHYVIADIEKDNSEVVLYFPDAGAAKRYAELFPKYQYCYGEKKRDWKTGKISGLEIKNNGIDLQDKTILMIDDIISYGGSLYYSAKTLKECGTGEIYSYATHTENSILDREKGTLIKSLEDGTVTRLYTTDSLFTGTHEKITVMEVD